MLNSLWTLLNVGGGICFFALASLAFSLCLTRMCIGILPLFGFMDKPDPRKIHVNPIVRGGGIAIWLSFLLVSLGFFFFCRPESISFLTPLIAPTLLIGFVGIIDDRFDLSAKIKLLAQIVAGLLIFFSGARIDIFFSIPLPWLVSLAFTVIWVVVLINAFNLIDGLDGLAIGMAIIASLSMTCWGILITDWNLVAVMLIFAGSCIGFFRYNFNPAKIFMGDTGSMFLGLVFAYVALKTMSTAVTFSSVLVPFLAVGVPIFDVVLAFWRRLARKLISPTEHGIMDPDKEHLHHRFMEQYHDQKRTAFHMYLIAFALALIAMLAAFLSSKVPVFAYTVVLIVVFFTVRRFADIELHQSAKLILYGIPRPRNRVLLILLHPFLDLMLLVVAYVVMALLFPGNGWKNLYLLLGCTLPIFAVFLLGGIYRLYWSRATIQDFVNLAELLVLGGCFSFGFYSFLFRGGSCFYPAFVLFFLLAASLIALERMLVWYAESCLLRAALTRGTDMDLLPKVLIYGGGLYCRLYLSNLYHRHEQKAWRIVGILDDDRILYGQQVCGQRVLGGLDDLEELYSREPFDRIVVTSARIPEDNLQKLKNFCELHQVKLRKFTIAEHALDS